MPNPNPNLTPTPKPNQVRECMALLRGAVADAWARLLKPSLAREVHREMYGDIRRYTEIYGDMGRCVGTPAQAVARA